MMQASPLLFEITEKRIVSYHRHLVENFDGFLHNGKCWYNLNEQEIPADRISCSIFELSNVDMFSKIVDLATSKLRCFLEVYGIAKIKEGNRPDSYFIITERVDCTLENYFWNQPSSYDAQGFLLKEISDVIRGVMTCFKDLTEKKIYHSGVMAKKNFLARGKVKLLFALFNCKNSEEEKWNGNKQLEMGCLRQMFNVILPRLPPPASLVAEYKSFCGVKDYADPKVYLHPFLLSHEEREDLPIRVRPRLKDRNRMEELMNKVKVGRWTARIDAESICGAVLNYPYFKRQEIASKLAKHMTDPPTVYDPPDYKDSFKRYIDDLRNFGVHITDDDTLDNYQQQIGDHTADVPSLPERNLALETQLGDRYLLIIYEACTFEELRP